MPGLLEENLVVVGVVGIGEHDVGVAIDEAGEDGGLGEVDDVGAGWDLDFVGWGDTGDFVAVDDDDLIAEHFSRADIEEMAGADVGVGGGGAARVVADAINAATIAVIASTAFAQRRIVPPEWRRDSNAKTSGWADLFGKGKPRHAYPKARDLYSQVHTCRSEDRRYKGVLLAVIFSFRHGRVSSHNYYAS